MSVTYSVWLLACVVPKVQRLAVRSSQSLLYLQSDLSLNCPVVCGIFEIVIINFVYW